MGIFKEFIEFVKKQNVIAVALGLVTGFAAKTLIDALVADLITPIYSPYITFLNPDLAIEIGLSKFMVGHFIQSLISFLVVLFVVFIIGKKLAKTM
ncbi:MAG: MscL family protein [Candidatus Aenigmatarchaeota archaeon]